MWLNSPATGVADAKNYALTRRNVLLCSRVVIGSSFACQPRRGIAATAWRRSHTPGASSAEGAGGAFISRSTVNYTRTVHGSREFAEEFARYWHDEIQNPGSYNEPTLLTRCQYRPAEPGVTYTYFVECLDRVKIGKSTNPAERLGTSAPFASHTLIVLNVQPESVITEEKAHQMWAHLRRKDEWYLLADGLKRWILEFPWDGLIPRAS